MRQIEGGCLCGNIRYSCAADPILTVLCNCTNCQKLCGSFSLNMALPRGSVDVQGEMACYIDTGDSGKPLKRFFCGNCGAAIYNEPDAIPDFTVLKAGTLDDTSWLNPTMQIYCDSTQPWLKLANELESKPKGL